MFYVVYLLRNFITSPLYVVAFDYITWDCLRIIKCVKANVFFSCAKCIGVGGTL
jgi:hypothetical protein